MLLNILIVDDDKIIGPVVKDYLESKDLDVTLINNGSAALKTLEKEDFDLCVLDVKMPGMSGFELAQEIQQKKPGLPFLFLTGEDGKSKKLEGLQLGADDYITKPFNLEELFLRINIVTRRTRKIAEADVKPEQYAIGLYTFKPSTRELSGASGTRQLSAIEAQLLAMFCESENRTIEREAVLRKIWKDESMFRTRSLNVYVSKLREYLKEDANIEILNIHGQGYSLVIK